MFIARLPLLVVALSLPNRSCTPQTKLRPLWKITKWGRDPCSPLSLFSPTPPTCSPLPLFLLFSPTTVSPCSLLPLFPLFSPTPVPLYPCSLLTRALFLYGSQYNVTAPLEAEQAVNLTKPRTWTIKGRSSYFVVEILNKSSRKFVASWIGLSNVFTTLICWLVQHKWTPSFLTRSLQERSCTFANGDAI